jgi:hypothetical protein
VVAAVISLIALFVSFRFSKASLDRARAAAAVAEFNAKVAFRKNLLDWGSSAQEALADGHATILYLKPNEPDFDRRLLVSIARLSAAIDRGRWLLPNTDHTDYGTNKEAAYTGLRQESLDALVGAHDTFVAQLKKQGMPAEQAAKSLTKFRREFTSAIQLKIEPRVLEQQLSELQGRVLGKS